MSSARSGNLEWILQRFTALYLAGFLIFVVTRFLLWPISSHAEWVGWMGRGGIRLAWGLAIASMLIHAWIGMRSVYLDYAKPLWVRATIQAVTAFGLIAIALWAFDILTGSFRR